jgi:hypothetical protein
MPVPAAADCGLLLLPLWCTVAATLVTFVILCTRTVRLFLATLAPAQLFTATFLA